MHIRLYSYTRIYGIIPEAEANWCNYLDCFSEIMNVWLFSRSLGDIGIVFWGHAVFDDKQAGMVGAFHFSSTNSVGVFCLAGLAHSDAMLTICSHYCCRLAHLCTKLHLAVRKNIVSRDTEMVAKYRIAG